MIDKTQYKKTKDGAPRFPLKTAVQVLRKSEQFLLHKWCPSAYC